MEINNKKIFFKEMKKRIKDNIISELNESFSSWCDSNVPKFDMVGFTTSMNSMFGVFNKLFEMDEVYKFKFMIYDEARHKEVLYEYPDDKIIVASDKAAQYFTDLLKSKLGIRPDELAKNMK